MNLNVKEMEKEELFDALIAALMFVDIPLSYFHTKAH